MDRYTECRATYPNADVLYVGHSNGTYLLARALRDYPGCRFKHVVLAGSVIPSSFPWQRYLQSKPERIKAILNYVATADWVVAFFPKTWEILRLQDIGGGGFDGFKTFRHGKLPVKEIHYVKGGHGAALDERNWDDIAGFVLRG